MLEKFIESDNDRILASFITISNIYIIEYFMFGLLNDGGKSAMHVPRINLSKLLPIIFIIVYTIVIGFEYTQGKSYIDSDMAAEMVMAKQLNDEGVLISENWYYGTEFRVLCEPTLYKLTLALFPDNWHMARVSAKAVVLLMLAAAFFYLCKMLKLPKVACWLGATVIIMPFGFWNAFHSIMGPIYATHMIYVILLMSLTVHYTPGGVLLA